MQRKSSKLLAYAMAGMLSFSMLFTTNGFMLMNVTEVQAGEVASLTPDINWYTAVAQEYTLNTAAELLGFSQLANAGNNFEGVTIKLGDNIDLSGQSWNPINSFKGTFDGNGYSISNLNIEATLNSDHPRSGFFAQVEGTVDSPAQICNVTIRNGEITVNNTVPSQWGGTDGGTGLLVGYGKNILLSNCRIESGKVSVIQNQNNYSNAGGLIGYVGRGTIEDCEALDVTVNTINSTAAGMVCGRLNGDNPKNNPYLPCKIVNVRAQGQASSVNYAGGIIGYCHDGYKANEGIIENVIVAEGSVISSSGQAGGIVGYDNLNIKNAVNYGSVTGETGGAGIACLGSANLGVTLENCMNFGDISGKSYVSGLLTKLGTASASASIENCANLGKVTVKEEDSQTVTDVFVTGADGFGAAISNSYSIGQATGSDGTISAPNQKNTYTNVYIQAEDAGETEGVHAMTAEQFKDRTVVDALNENDDVEDIVWYQNEQYPDLAYNMTLTTDIEVPQSLEVTVGEEADAKASVTPEDATVKTLLYSSSDETVAVVSEEGVITGVKAGTAEITVTAFDTGHTARIAVTVKEAAQPQEPSTPADNAGTTPTQPSTPSQSSAGQDTTPARGQQVRVGTNTYVITNTASKAVEFSGTAKKKVAKVTIPASVKIGNTVYKVTSIAKNAFKNNKKIKTVVIGKNVKSVGQKAFFGCKNLRKITVKSKVLTKVGAKAFKGINKKAVIKVPAKKYSAYRKLLRGKGQAGTVTIKK